MSLNPHDALVAVPPSPAGAGPFGVAPVARVVAEDLEAIFPGQPPSSAARGLRLRLLRRRRVDAAPTRERRLATIGALIAAACVGVVAGALYSRASHPEAVGSVAAPAATESASVAAELPEPGPLAPAFARPAPQTLIPLKESTTRSAPGKTVAVRAHRPKRVQPAPACSPGAGCSYSAVLAADDRLRRAYRTAERAGVSRPVLVSYRNRWAGLRGRSTHDPGSVVRGYRQMASELEQLSRRGAMTRAAREGERRRLAEIVGGGVWR